MPKIKPIELDGSTLEGGGQLVRVALSLSAITGIPVHVYNIRANRAPHGRFRHTERGQGRGGRGKAATGGGSGKVEGGLKESHLAALIYLARQCNADVEGAEVGSREITFIPKPASRSTNNLQATGENALVDPKSTAIELRNPGSVWLILQAILPFFVFGKLAPAAATQSEQQINDFSANQVVKDGPMVELTLKGGTNVSKSMSGEYAQHVLIPTLCRMGLPAIGCEIKERGWAGSAPKLGEVHISMSRPPADSFTLRPFEIKDRGDLEKITVHIVAGGEEIGKKLERGLRKVITEQFGPLVPVDVLQMENSGDFRRLYILLVARTTNGWRLGRDFLGSGRTPKNEAELEKILKQACQTVVRELKSEVKRGGCVDEFLQDQLVIFQALASGTSTVYGGDWANESNNDEQECGDGEGSLHTRTVRWVCEKMLRKQDVEFEIGGKCQGIGCNSLSSEASLGSFEALNIREV